MRTFLVGVCVVMSALVADAASVRLQLPAPRALESRIAGPASILVTAPQAAQVLAPAQNNQQRVVATDTASILVTMSGVVLHRVELLYLGVGMYFLVGPIIRLGQKHCGLLRLMLLAGAPLIGALMG